MQAPLHPPARCLQLELVCIRGLRPVLIIDAFSWPISFSPEAAHKSAPMRHGALGRPTSWPSPNDRQLNLPRPWTLDTSLLKSPR